MADRWLKFSEAQELLGVTSDDLRELMEAGTLQGRIIDGVVQFAEADVKRMARGGPSKGSEAHLRFLVDEEDEKKIEGKAYDGEALAPPKRPDQSGEDEDLVAPMDLSEEQLRNSDLLGGRDIVDFGREVAERSTAAEFTHEELAGEEEILEPSEVELPEVEFGPLAGRMPEARREEPAEAAPVASAEPPAPATPEPPPAPPEDEILFVAEEPTPMMCPTTEEAKEESKAPRPVSIVTPIERETPAIEFVEEALKVEETPKAEPPAAGTVEPPVTDLSGVALAKSEAPAEPAGTYEVEPPAPAAPVTAGFGFAVDEETAEVAPEEAAPAPEPEAPTDEPAAEPVSMEAPEAEKVEPWEPEEAPAEEATLAPEPITPQAFAAGAVSAAAAEALAASAKPAKPAEPPPKAPPAPTPAEAAQKGVDEARAREIMEEIERELAAESAKEPLPQAPRHDTIPARTSQQSQGLVPKRLGPAGVPQEEAKPVTDEIKKPKPGEPPKVKKPEDIEVFDFEQPGAKKEEEFELLEEEPAAPTGAAPAKQKSLEDEMAELFGEEAKEAPLDQAFAAPQAVKPEEDFDLSVFQKDKQEEAAAEPAAITEEKLFEVESPRTETHEAVSDAEMQGVSRIRAISEERTPASVYLYTTAVIVAVLAVACAGMLLWYFAILRQ